MSEPDYVPLGLRILDEQLVDADGRRCGRVEDLELDGAPGEPARVVGILCGATAWKRRLPPRFAELFPGDPRGLRRVPWDDVCEVANEIELRRSEADLREASDTESAPAALSQLLGVTAVTEGGDTLGRVRDVLARRGQDGADPDHWHLHALLVGRRSLLQRLGLHAHVADEVHEGRPPGNLVAWERVRRFDDEGRLVVAS